MNKLLILATVLALSGCKLMEPKVVYRDVLTPVPCVKEVLAEPVLYHDSLGPEYPIDTLYTAALKDKITLQAYSNKLRVEVVACSKIPSLPTPVPVTK